MNLKQLITVTEATVLSAVAAFLAAVSQLSGPAFDAKHLEAAGVAAAVALAYKLSAILNSVVASVTERSVVVAPLAPSTAPSVSTPQTPAPQPPAAS